jgi:hypothetical protein
MFVKILTFSYDLSKVAGHELEDRGSIPGTAMVIFLRYPSQIGPSGHQSPIVSFQTSGSRCLQMDGMLFMLTLRQRGE